jgi:hypothetical protein
VTGRTQYLSCVFAAGGMLAFSVSSAVAAPRDPFTGASARFDEPPQQATNTNVGDWGVAEQHGAATYTLPLAVPPGRLKMEPHLALRYSSRSPVHGGIAAGWKFSRIAWRCDRPFGGSVGAVAVRRTRLPGGVR